MPRAFLIKKKQTAKSGSPSEKSWKHWSDSLNDDDAENHVDDIPGSRTLTTQMRTIGNVTLETKGPYDLSMKPKVVEEPVSLVNLSPEHHSTMPSFHRPTSTIAVVAPKPIKPTPKTPEDLSSMKSSWQTQMYSPYLPFNYTGYAYPSKHELYGPNATTTGYLMTHQNLVPPPLVPLAPSTSPTHTRERYSPLQDRYSPYDVPLRSRMSPPVVQSPSPPLAYSGWISDGQDSGLASSPSPSSEDGDLISNNAKHIANQTRYQCPDCNKSYSTYSGLSKHRLMHCSTQVKKSFNCKYCDKVYVSLGALKMHIRTHTLPCKCKLCGKAFSRPWLLQGHIRTHTGEKPFSCPHCSRAFADRSNLRAHLQTHSEVKKYRCKTCSKTFSRMSLLLKHEDGGCSGTTPQV